MPRINSGSSIDPSVSNSGTAQYYVTEETANRSVLTPLFAEETLKSSQEQLLHLISIEIPSDPETTLHIVDCNHDVKFNNVVYVKFPVKYAGVSLSSDGTIDKASLTVANVSREIMYWVEEFDGLRNQRVRIKTVFKNALDQLYELDPILGTFPTTDEAPVNPKGNIAAFIEDEYLIDNYTATEQIVNFTLEPIIDMQIKLPRRRYMVDSCYWKFKDPTTCKYAGEMTTCNLTLADCKKHIIEWDPIYHTPTKGNEENFGGFPGISGTRKIWL